ATGDLSDWTALSHPECLYCSGVIKDVTAMSAAGQHGEGGAFEVVDGSGAEVETGVWYSAKVRLTQEPSTTVDANGAVVEVFPERKSGVIDVAIVWEAGSWLIREATPSEDGSA